MSRHPTLDERALSQDQRLIHDTIANGPRGRVVGPLRVWLQSPGLATQAQALGQYARYDSVLSPVLSELAILVTARYWSSGFEWSHHAPIAQEVGVPAKAVEAISQAKRFTFSDAKMQAVFDFAVELHLLKNVSDVTYDTALKALGLQSCVDLVGICGYYTMISMTINVFDVPDGDGPMLPELDIPLTEYFGR
ncbi:carboxymuconolactone decarboxylase family protein [Planktotalea sp.]|uniref:carboxymuconolactone decarboxylase family protein n=1 Tax=Planktotalea sp. TaxID=2029877 RepID=UPI0025E87151|nr:carboxymuconolactone decarboxylase family protein [Planktotalea sp.]